MTSLAADKLRVRCCTDFHDLQSLAEDWNHLVDRAVYPNVFLRWEWVGTWWKWFGGGRPLRVYLVYDGPQLVGILPLYARRRMWWWPSRRMLLAPIGFGGPTCPEYLGLVVHRDFASTVVDSLMQEMDNGRRAWAAIELPDVAPDDPGTRALVEKWAVHGPVLSHPGVVCPACSLPKEYEQLLARLSRHRRWREKRRMRRACEECGAQLKVVSGGEEGLLCLPTFVRLSRSSRERAGHRFPFDNETYTGFHRELIRNAGRSELVRSYVLTFGDNAVAFQYGFLYAGKYYAFQTGFDVRMSYYNPGGVMFQMLLQDLIRKGVAELDYLRGQESYKYVFADRERRTTTFVLFPSRNAAYASYWSGQYLLKPFKRSARRILDAAGTLYKRVRAGHQGNLTREA